MAPGGRARLPSRRRRLTERWTAAARPRADADAGANLNSVKAIAPPSAQGPEGDALARGLLSGPARRRDVTIRVPSRCLSGTSNSAQARRACPARRPALCPARPPALSLGLGPPSPCWLAGWLPTRGRSRLCSPLRAGVSISSLEVPAARPSPRLGRRPGTARGESQVAWVAGTRGGGRPFPPSHRQNKRRRYRWMFP